MWFNGLPGIEAPAADEAQADRVIALACAARFKPVNPAGGGNATTDTENEADAFAEWLALAKDQAADRRARRLALCMACEKPSGTRRDILDAAERLRKTLSGQR
jgi:hypothetical protein